MLNKIKKAREIIRKYNEKYDIDFILRLEVIADELEFIFNNIDSNDIGSMKNENRLEKLEKELDKMLKQAENKKFEF